MNKLISICTSICIYLHVYIVFELKYYRLNLYMYMYIDLESYKKVMRPDIILGILIQENLRYTYIMIETYSYNLNRFYCR